MDPFLISLAFEGGGALFDMLANAGRPDPEEAYKQRVNEAIASIKDYFGGVRKKETSRANTESALAREMGAREKASQGYSGTANFSSARESSISDSLNQMLESLNVSEMGAISNIQTAGINRPIYAEPNTFDYLGALSRSTGKVLGKKAMLDYERGLQEQNIKEWKDAFKPSTSMGQDPMNQSIEQYNKLGEGYFGSPAAGSGFGSTMDHQKKLGEMEKRFQERNRF